jgi:hypothetical protein
LTARDIRGVRRADVVGVLALGLLAASGRFLPAGFREVALYPALGAFPGLLAARLLVRRTSGLDRWVLALALSPLLSTLVGYVLIALGVSLPSAGVLIAAVSWGGWLVATCVPEPASGAPDGAPSRTWLAWALGFAALVAALPLLNHWILIHFDGWFHAGMVWEIVLHGVPPQSPNFAGPPSNYMWMYHVYVGLLTAAGGDPFVMMAILNVADAFVLVGLVHHLGWLLWRDERAANGAVAMALLGLNAGTWLLWPLCLVKAWTGDVTGWNEIHRILLAIRPLSDHVTFSLSAPFTVMLSLLDKFTEGTALNYAWVLLLLVLWGMLDWLGGGRRSRLALVALGTGGIFLFHGVVALSATPVLFATMAVALILRRRWRWLPGPARMAGLAAAMAGGILLGLPYLWGLLRGWTAPGTSLRHSALTLRPAIPWTIATSLAVVAWLAWGPLRRACRESRPGPVLVAIGAAITTAFTLVVHLPVDNESKFIFQILFLLALLAGAAFHPWLTRLVSRRGRPGATAIFAVLFVVGPVLTVVGYAADPAGRTSSRLRPTPAERTLYEWIRERTETNAVFLDAQQRDLIMVLGRRRLYLGTRTGTDQFAFPAQEVSRRQALMDDLYGPCRDPKGDAATLRTLGCPVYVVYRPEDRLPDANPADCAAAHPDLFQPVLAVDDYRVCRLRER